MVVSVRARRVMSFCLVFLMLLSASCRLGSGKVHAADGASFYFEESSALMNTTGRELVDDYSEGHYYAFAAADKVESGALRGKPSLVSTARDTDDGAFYIAYEEARDLSAFNELCFQMRVDGSSGSCAVQMTFSAAGKTYDVKGSFEAGKTYDVYCPLASFEERDRTDHIYFYYSSDGDLDSVTVSALYADDRFTYAHADRFSSDDFKIDTLAEISEKSITITPAAGACSLEASRLGREKAGNTVISRVSVSGVETGTLALFVKDKGAAEYSDISTINLFPGDNSYTFIYDISKGNDAYMLSFSGAECTNGMSLSVNSVSFTYYDEKIEEVSESLPALISSCSVSSDGKSVNVKGTVSSGFVVGNIDGKICIVAEDMWGKSAPVIVASADMSTMFDIKFSAAGLPALPYLCKYSVALLGEGEGEYERESQPVFPSAPTGALPGARTILGVESDDTSAPFECDASYTVFEIDLERLMTGDPASGRFHSYAGSYYYLSTSYLAEIEKTLGFYLQSGLKVYVRAVVPDDTGDGIYGCPDADDTESVMSCAAAIDYITEKYPSVYGAIAGCRINTFTYNRSNKDDLFLYAENYAKYLRVVSCAAKSNNPSCIVTVPFGDGYVYGGKSAEYDGITGVGKDSCDPIMLSVLISKFLSVGGGVQWYMMYECEDEPKENAELLSRAASRLAQNVGSAPAGHILYWRPDGGSAAEDLSSLSEELGFTSLGTRSFIISLTGKSVDEETTGAIKRIDTYISRGEGIRVSTAASSYDTSVKGHVFIKDFRTSYGTGDFFSGGTVSSLTTETADVMSAFEGKSGLRALRATGDGSDGGCGVIMANYPDHISLGAADHLNVAMCVSGEGEEFPVKIVIGDGTQRYEFDCTAASGEPAVFMCPLDGVDIDASYIAAEVFAPSAYTVDISRITLSRNDGNERAISDAVGGDTSEKKDSRALITSLIAVAVFTLAVFAVLSVRKDKGESGAESKDGAPNERKIK